MAAYSSTGAEKEGGGQATLESHLPELGASVPELVRVDSNNVAAEDTGHRNINGGADEVIVNTAHSKVLKSISSSPSNKSSDSKEFHPSPECKKKRRRRKGDKLILHSVENSSSSSTSSQKKEDDKDKKSSSKVSFAQNHGTVSQPPEESSLDEDVHLKTGLDGCSTEEILFQQTHVKQSKIDSDSSGSTLSDVFANQLLSEPCHHVVPDLVLINGPEPHENLFNSKLNFSKDHYSELGTTLNNDFIIQLLLDHMGFVWKKCGTSPPKVSQKIENVLIGANTTVQEDECKEVVDNLVSNKLKDDKVKQLNINDEQIKISEEGAGCFEHQADRSAYVTKVIIQPLVTEIIQEAVATVKQSCNDCALVNQYDDKSSDSNSGSSKIVLANGSQQLCRKASAVLSLSKLNGPQTSYELRFHNQPWIQSTSTMTDPNSLHVPKADHFKRSRRIKPLPMKTYSEFITSSNIEYISKVIVARLNFILSACGQPHERLPYYVRPLIFDGKHMTMEELYEELELLITETSTKSNSRCTISEMQTDITDDFTHSNSKSPSDVTHTKLFANYEHGNSTSNTSIIEFLESLLESLLNTLPEQETTPDTNVPSKNSYNIQPTPELHELSPNKLNVEIGDTLLENQQQTIPYLLESSTSFNDAVNEFSGASDAIRPKIHDTSLNRQFAYTNLLKTITIEKTDGGISQPVACHSTVQGGILRMKTSSTIDLLSKNSETFSANQCDKENMSEESINTKQYPCQNRHSDTTEDSGLSQSDSECSSNSLDMFVLDGNEDIVPNAWSGSDSSTQIVNARKLYTIPEVSCESSLNEEAGFAVTIISDDSLYTCTTEELSNQLAEVSEKGTLVQYQKGKNLGDENAVCTLNLLHTETTSVSSSDSTNSGIFKLATCKVSSADVDSVNHEIIHTERQLEHAASYGSISREFDLDLDSPSIEDTESKMCDPMSSEGPLMSRETLQYLKPTMTYGIQTDISFDEHILPGHTAVDSNTRISPAKPFSEADDLIAGVFEKSVSQKVYRDVNELRVMTAQAVYSHDMQTATSFTGELLEASSASTSAHEKPTGDVIEVNSERTDPSVFPSMPTSDTFQQNVKHHLPSLLTNQPDPMSEVLDEVCRDLTFLSKGICGKSNALPLQNILTYNNSTTLGGTLSPKVLLNGMNGSDSASVSDSLPNRAEEVYSSGDGTKSPVPVPETFDQNSVLYRTDCKVIEDACEHTNLLPDCAKVIAPVKNNEVLCNIQADEVNLNKLNISEKNASENLYYIEQSSFEKLAKHANGSGIALGIQNNDISTKNSLTLPAELCKQPNVQAQGTCSEDKQSMAPIKEVFDVEDIKGKDQTKSKTAIEQIDEKACVKHIQEYMTVEKGNTNNNLANSFTGNSHIQTLANLRHANENEFATFLEENCVLASSSADALHGSPTQFVYAMEAGVLLNEDQTPVHKEVSWDGVISNKTQYEILTTDDVNMKRTCSHYTSYNEPEQTIDNEIVHGSSCLAKVISDEYLYQDTNNEYQDFEYNVVNKVCKPVQQKKEPSVFSEEISKGPYLEDISVRETITMKKTAGAKTECRMQKQDASGIPEVLCTQKGIYSATGSKKQNSCQYMDTQGNTMGDAKGAVDVCDFAILKEVYPESNSQLENCLGCMGMQSNNIYDLKVSDDEYTSDGLGTVKDIYAEVCSGSEISISCVDPQVYAISDVKLSPESQKRILFESMELMKASSEDTLPSESKSTIDHSSVSIHTELVFAEGDSQGDSEFQCSNSSSTDLVASPSSQKPTLILMNTTSREKVSARETNICTKALPKMDQYHTAETNGNNKLPLCEHEIIVEEIGVEKPNGPRFLEDEKNHNAKTLVPDDREDFSFVGAVGSKYYPAHGDECKTTIPCEQCLSKVSPHSSRGFQVNACSRLGLAVAISNRNIFEDICNEADTFKCAECSKSLSNDPVCKSSSERPSAGCHKMTTNLKQHSVFNNQRDTSMTIKTSSDKVEHTNGSHCEQQKPLALPLPLELSSYENVINPDTQNQLSSEDDSECESLFELSAIVEDEHGGIAVLGNNSLFEVIPNECQSEELLTPHATSSNEDLLSKVTENNASESVSLSDVMHVELNSDPNVDLIPEDKSCEALPAIATWSYENLHHKSSAVIQQSLSTSSECLHIGITSLLKSSHAILNGNDQDDASPESADSSYENVHARVIIEQPSSSTSSENSTHVVIWSAGLSPKPTSSESVQIEDVPTSALSSFENMQSNRLIVQPLSSSSSSGSMQNVPDSSMIASSRATSHESIRCANLSPSPVSSFENVAHEDVLLPHSAPSTTRQNENIPRSATTLSTGSFEALAARASNSLHSATSLNSIILQSCSSGSSTCLYRSRARDFTGLMEYVGKLNSLASGRDSSGETNSLAAQRSLSTPVVDTAHSPTNVDESKSEVDSDHSARSYKIVNKTSCVELNDDDQDQSNNTVFSKLNALRRFMPFTCFLSPSSSDGQIDETEQSSTPPEFASKGSDKISSTLNILDQELD